jgi:glycosyltransferase involved in cell wall biosynthesis
VTLVSCVVTTCHRPTLVGRAVESVLGQTHAELGLIVVVDGPDAATAEALRTYADPRLRVVVQPARGGQAAALNAGIALAQGAFVAFLDDDDAWLPAKIARQLAAAEAAGRRGDGDTRDARVPIVGCRFVARRETGDVVWPTRAPRPDESIAEWLFCRRRLRFGEGIMPTSMLFAPAPLLREIPFTAGIRQHCDLDWYIRADQRGGVQLVLPRDEAPLAIWEMQTGRPRMSNVHDWRATLAWIDAHRTRITPRAYAGFLLTWISDAARRQRDRAAFTTLLAAAFRHGRPSLTELLVHAGTWVRPA